MIFNKTQKINLTIFYQNNNPYYQSTHSKSNSKDNPIYFNSNIITIILINSAFKFTVTYGRTLTTLLITQYHLDALDRKRRLCKN